MRCSITNTLALLILCFLTLTGDPSSAMAKDADAEDSVVISSQDDVLLSRDDMKIKRGTFGITNALSSEQMLETVAEGNALNVGGDLTNGNINFGDNFGGFGSYVMNTGNNSAISSAVTVNVQMMSGP